MAKAYSHVVPGTNSSLKSNTAASVFCSGWLSSTHSDRLWTLLPSGSEAALCHFTATKYLL